MFDPKELSRMPPANRRPATDALRPSGRDPFDESQVFPPTGNQKTSQLPLPPEIRIGGRYNLNELFLPPVEGGEDLTALLMRLNKNSDLPEEVDNGPRSDELLKVNYRRQTKGITELNKYLNTIDLGAQRDAILSATSMVTAQGFWDEFRKSGVEIFSTHLEVEAIRSLGNVLRRIEREGPQVHSQELLDVVGAFLEGISVA